MAKTYAEAMAELQAQDNELPTIKALRAEPIQEEATAAPKATGLTEYYLNRGARSLLGEGTTSLLGLVLPKSIGEPLQKGYRSQLNRMGLPEMAPPGFGATGRMQSKIGNVVAGATDPLALAPIGKAPLLMRSLEGALGATGAEIGGEVGQGLGGSTGQLVGGVVGGVMGGSVPRKAGLVKDVATTGITKGIAKVKGGGKEELEQLNVAADQMANGYINNILEAVTATDPNFATKLDKSLFETGQMGVNMPLANLVNNPILRQEVETLLAKSGAFRTKYETMWKDAQDIVNKKALSQYGSPQEAAMLKVGSDIPLAGKKVDKRMQAMDNTIAKVSAAYSAEPNNQKLGARLTTLIDAKEAAAKQAASPAYDDAFKYAEEKGLVLPDTEVERLYNYVRDERNAEIFRTFPNISSKIDRLFSPTVQEGLDFNPVTLEINKMDKPLFGAKEIKDLDSLKKEVNFAIRKTRDDRELRFLTDLKGQIQTSIEAVDPTFSGMYKGADDAYRASVGVPFNSETARMIDRAKFDENVVPLITRNKSMLQEMLQATGDEGIPIAEAAFLGEFGRRAVPNGVLDPKKATQWIKDNSDEISLIPGLREKLEDSRNVVANITDSKDALKANFARAKAADIIGKEGLTIKQIIDKSIADPAYLTTFLKKHGNNEDALTAVRSFALDDLLAYKNPMEAFNDKTKGAFYNRVFGGRLEGIKELAKVSGMISSFDPETINVAIKSAVPKDALAKATGVPANTAFSILRDRIMSPIQKIFVLTNKSLTAKADESTSKMLGDILIDPKRIQHLVSGGKKLETGEQMTMEEANNFLKSVMNFSKKYATPGEGGARGGAVGATTQAQEIQDKPKKPLTYEDAMKQLEEQP